MKLSLIHECLGNLDENLKLKQRLKQRHVELSFLKSRIDSIELEKSALLKQQRPRKPESSQTTDTQSTRRDHQTVHVQTEDYLDLERLKQKVELQKQLIEEQDLLLQQCLSAESDGDSIQLSDSIRGAFEILESSGDDRIMSVVQVLRNEYQRLKNRNDLAQQLIREYEQLDRNAT